MTINVADRDDHDAYWYERRGEGLGGLSQWQKSRADLARKAIQNTSGKEEVVLGDIGCGDGAVLRYLREHIDTVSRTVGFDASASAREAAMKNGVEAHPLELSKEGWSQSLVQCDYYILFEIIEHVADSEQLVTTAFAFSRKGVFISVPNTGFILYRLRLLFGKFPMQWVNVPSEHLRFWTYTDMCWWLEAIGLGKRWQLKGYRGVGFFTKIWPSLFAPGLFVFIESSE